MKIRIVTSPDALLTMPSPEWRWSDRESATVRETRTSVVKTKEDYLQLESAVSSKELYQPFLKPYLESANRCLVIGAGWGFVERRWIDPFRSSGRRLLLTDVNEVALEPIERLWLAETKHLDILDLPQSLEERFDLTYAVLVESILDDAEYVKMASNMARTLDRASGANTLVFIVANIRAGTLFNPLRLAYRRLGLHYRLSPALRKVLGRREMYPVGWQRTVGTHRSLLRSAGLRISRLVPLASDRSFSGKVSRVGASAFLGIETVPL